MYTIPTGVFSGVVLQGNEGGSDSDESMSVTYCKTDFLKFSNDAVSLGRIVTDMGDGTYFRAIDPEDGRASGEFETKYGGMMAFGL